MNTRPDIPVLVIFAPTACGKTELAEKLFASDSSSALAGKAEIISADSMQVYCGMNIGTAKPSVEFLQRLPHHLINLYLPNIQFGLGDFVQRASDACKDIYERGKLPVLLGGTAFYIKGFVYGLPATPKADDSIRCLMQYRMESEGAQKLWTELSCIDPISAAKIHIHDEYRIKRALEVYFASGKPLSSFTLSNTRQKGYRFLFLSLERSRAELCERIDRRVELMFEQGLADEVRSLQESGFGADCAGMQAIGYKEFFTIKTSVWKNEVLAEVKELIKKNSRAYSKRQQTFFKSFTDILPIEADAFLKIEKKILNFCFSVLAYT